MNADLQRLIRLQEIESRVAEARRRIADTPAEIASLDARLTAAREAVAAAKQSLADNQAARRAIEKDLAVVQQRLGKFKEQLMEVKTNAEYHAMQHQIAAADAEVAKFEEQILVTMLDADEITAKVKAAEGTLKADEGAVARERAVIQADAADKERLLAESEQERADLLPQIDRQHLELFERIFKGRQGIAVAQAVDGHCSICHVRLRPQIYNTIRRNEEIVQCDHCQRVLYFAGMHQRSAAGQATVDNAHARQIEADTAPQ